jgi:hypothetical protein
MSATITLDERWIDLSNASLDQLFADVIMVGKELAQTELEREYVQRLTEVYPGFSPDLGGLFPTLDEKKFWANCFFEASRWHCVGRIQCWPDSGVSQARWVFQTYWCADALSRFIYRHDRTWRRSDTDYVLGLAADERHREEYARKHEAAMAKECEERIEEAKQRALRDAKYASRNCPECGFPCSDWLQSCRVCGYAIGRFKPDRSLPG